ncbi:MFS general substrate transporter [Bimuria novae-zelandiae CBS 107.79]|uniref:MFS general substrate transporter n=1 Tax=Bimuria novae-zelandiae CBS 107.79 TaxID=1447943 RepID=A0A6A5UZ57_9PLEO|nr:MFS general substrate transporter [Bimuria novae-zelandiae CBS 107.79]
MQSKEISQETTATHRVEDSKSTVDTLEQAYPPAPEKVALHAQDGDEETARYASQRGHIDEATNKRLFWKINKRILIIMLVTYFCQSLDKGTLGFSSIMGIKTDAHLTGQDYPWLGTILYMGILAGEYPQNFLLQKLPVGKFLATNVFLWGTVVTCSAASKTFGSLMAVRFLLGFFESCVQPTFIILTTMWYTREEQTLLTSLWYSMTGVQLMVGGLIAYGVSHYKGGVIFSWQLLFLILGCCTVAWSAVIFFILPDSPMRAKGFTEEEKVMLVERVRHNETGIQNRKYKRYQVVEAFTDSFVWCCVALILVCNLVIGGLGVFSNLIIAAFGFTVLQTQLLNIAQGAVTIIVMLGSAYLAQKTGQTCLIMVIWTIPAIIGTGVILGIKPTSSNAGGLLIAFYCTQFFLAQGNMIISLVSRNIAGQTKKGITLTLTFVGWSVGNMIAPQLFQTNDAPRYTHGFIAHLCIYGVYLLIVVLTRVILMRRNAQKRQASAAAAGTDGENAVSHDLAFQDLTDLENPNFRYVY